jgi:hypothetical protein
MTGPHWETDYRSDGVVEELAEFHSPRLGPRQYGSEKEQMRIGVPGSIVIGSVSWIGPLSPAPIAHPFWGPYTWHRLPAFPRH